ncbi:Malectin-like domain, partial [Dillenia turbinata]
MDEYSGIWEAKFPNGTVVVNASFDGLYSMTIDDPPDVAIIQAVEATTPADAITLSFPSSKGKSLDHVTVDFTEVDELEIRENRHFDFNVNGEKMLTLNPEYRTCSAAWANLQSEGTLTLELCPTEDSTLPLIISAIEVYTASDSLVTTGTSQDDRMEWRTLSPQVLVFDIGRLAAVMTLQ